MKKFSTILLVMFVAMFWVFRMIVAFMHEIGQDLGGIAPFNQQMEIILLFVVLVCMILIVKRKIVGALIYLVAYGLYFGTNLVSGITTLFNQGDSIIDITLYMNMFISLLGVALPIAVLLDLLLDGFLDKDEYLNKKKYYETNLLKMQNDLKILHQEKNKTKNNKTLKQSILKELEISQDNIEDYVEELVDKIIIEEGRCLIRFK